MNERSLFEPLAAAATAPDAAADHPADGLAGGRYRRACLDRGRDPEPAPACTRSAPNAAALAATVAADAAPLLVIDDFAALEEQLLRAAALPDVLAIQVLDATGQVVSNVMADADGLPHPGTRRSCSRRRNTTGWCSAPAATASWSAWTPVVSGERGRLGAA
ncbi:MAG: hypothetical protein MZV65_54350 [Chromatiales bacterium]|nr:hypothetical protein [Chromatiales bacterium]